MAAHACLLVLKRPDLGLYPRTREIIVFPDAFGEIVETIAPDGRKYYTIPETAGQMFRRGPLLIAWEAARMSIAHPEDGYNVMLHEFAHALDHMDGEVNGMPPLNTRAQAEQWVRVIPTEYKALRRALDRGEATLIRPYGATSEIEFFAVVTECFFECGPALKAGHPDLYEAFRMFYNQDPAAWP